MKLYRRLQGQALLSANQRGHTMTRFRSLAPSRGGRSWREAQCERCDAWVQIDTQPPPNSIDIGGPAVAIGCNPKRGA